MTETCTGKRKVSSNAHLLAGRGWDDMIHMYRYFITLKYFTLVGTQKLIGAGVKRLVPLLSARNRIPIYATYLTL